MPEKLSPKTISDKDRIDLALAWAKGELSGAQIAGSLKSPTSMYCIVATGLKLAIQQGLLVPRSK